MSFLSEIHGYISGNSTITNALPATSIYTGLIPEKVTFPYCVIVPISLTPTATTGAGYIATFDFQISIFDTDPDNVESVANTIGGQFDYKTISSSTISCERTNGPILIVDQDGPKRVYHAMLEYQLLSNRTLPTVG